MKIIHTIIKVILVTFITADAYAQFEVQVIPYKILNPGNDFSISTGREYAKLITLASAIKKNIVIYPHTKTEAALKKLSINTQRIITEDDLISIGNTGNADCILIGTLSKSKGSYTTDSILYSIRNKRIMSKSHYKSGSLFKLAEGELNQIFFNVQNKKRILRESYADIAVVLDLSYKIAPEWNSVKNGIVKFVNTVSDNWSVDTSVNVLPFSGSYSENNKILNLNSNFELKNTLSKMATKGDTSDKNFKRVLEYSIKNMPWRRKSDKILLLITNSNSDKTGFIEKYAISAKMLGISVSTITLGLLKDRDTESFREFSGISSGRHYNAAYHQRFYNESGNPVDVFYEGGRIFHSLVYNSMWEEGLFESSSNSEWAKPRSFLTEIFYDRLKQNINPYNLSEKYHIISSAKILNYARLENNIESIMTQIGNTYEFSSGKMKYKKPIAKVQITDGTISMWIKIKEEDDLVFFKNMNASNDYFHVGAIIKRNTNEPYGITFYPDWYATEFSNDFIPEIIKTDLSGIIKKPEFYLSNGLFTPPFWFLNLKVERVEKYSREHDIREHASP
ncbi:MAG: VWA domain-containing protein [Spirochaetes bacterium]|nr:VWA domain-containing protein [Spirochaetota bacterium]